MLRSIRLLTVFIFCCVNAYSQVSYYVDTFKGGVTGAGYAPDYSGGGTGIINVYIEPGSTIRKAFLFAGRHGSAGALAVTLNGTSLVFDNLSQVSPTFQSPYGGNSGVHAIDVTSVVSASVTSYSLMVPSQSGPSDRFTDFYLFITYDNAALSNISTQFFVNDQSFSTLVNYTFNLAFPVNSLLPLAVGLDLGYACSESDADQVYLNGTNLGVVYGPEANSGSCQGPCANFYYQNNAISALSGNNANQGMNGSDVLSDAQALIPNNSTSFTMELTHSSSDDSRWGFFIVSGANCTPPVAVAGPDTIICSGYIVPLHSDGGTAYLWSPGTGLSDSTIAAPNALPEVTTTYTVTVSNNCGSSTSTVSIVVHPSPPTPTIKKSNDTLYCSFDPSYTSYQWYYHDTLIAGATLPYYFATKSGNYNVAVTDENGCQISVGTIINVNGIQNLFADNSIYISPNPASGELYIYSSREGSLSGNYAVVILNMLGEKLFSFTLSFRESRGEVVNIKTLPAGVYLVQMVPVKSEESGSWIGKFVKD